MRIFPAHSDQVIVDMLHLLKTKIVGFSWLLPAPKLAPTETATSLWIVGPAHSGTSITMRILSHHNSVYCVTGESQIAFKSSQVARKLYKDWITASRQHEKSIILEKTPRHLDHLDRLRLLNERSKILICMRRPSSNFISVAMKRLKGNQANHTELSLIFREIVTKYKAILHAVQDFHNQVYISRLESLILCPETHIRNLLCFAGLDSSADIVSSMIAAQSSSDLYMPYSGFKGASKANLLSSYSDVDRSSHNLRRDLQINMPLFHREPILSFGDIPGLPQSIICSLKSLDTLFGYQ